ncbi:MAG: LOG family protein [Symbiopectobacterium sp.]
MHQHGIIISPGGVGTAEEFLYLLNIMMNPENSEQVLPIILTGSGGKRRLFPCSG